MSHQKNILSFSHEILDICAHPRNLTNRKNSYMVSLYSRWRKGFIRPGASPRPVAPLVVLRTIRYASLSIPLS